MLLKIVHEQIQFHKTLYALPKKDLLSLLPTTADLSKPPSQLIYSYLVKKNEKDVIRILLQL